MAILTIASPQYDEGNSTVTYSDVTLLDSFEDFRCLLHLLVCCWLPEPDSLAPPAHLPGCLARTCSRGRRACWPPLPPGPSTLPQAAAQGGGTGGAQGADH